MKIGLYLPHWTGALGGEDPRWDDVLDTARVAEEIGFDSVWVIGHHYLPFERGAPWSLWEPWSLLAALAAGTDRISLGPLVACTAYTNPALLARAAATVDEISGGRLILGLGCGYFGAEFEALGIPAGHKVDRFAEAISIIEPLLRGAAVDVEGRWYRAALPLDLPQPHASGPPLLVGASQPRMMQLTATHADLWNAWLPFSNDPVGDLREQQRALDKACAEVGRDPATLGRTAAVAVGVLGGTVRYGPYDMVSLGHDGDEVAAVLQALEAEGVDHVQVALAPATPKGVEALGSVIEAVAGR